MNVGTLNIEIAANVARIQADMEATKRVVGGAMKDVEQYVGYAKNAFLLLGGVTSIAAFKGIIDGGIAAKAKLYDLSLQTGITVESLGALGRVAKYSDIPLADVASASNKLSKSLFTQTEDSKGAAQAIKALGLNFGEFASLSADQQMLKVAKALGQFEDGTGKSAAAMLLFGKTGATLLPFLKDLAEKSELVSKQTSESARQAKEYEKNLIDMKRATEEWRNEAVTGMLPTLLKITNGILDAKKAFGGFFSGGAALSIDLSQGPGAALRRINGDLDKALGEYNVLAAKVAAGQKPSFFSSPGRSIGDLASEVKELSQQREFVKAQQLREALAADVGYGDEARFRKKQLGLGGKDDSSGAKRDDYTPLIKSIKEKIAANKAEFESLEKLTEGQKMQAKVFADIDGGFVKIKLDQKLYVDGLLQEVIAGDKQNLARQQERKFLSDLHDQQGIALQDSYKAARAAEDEAKVMQDQVAQYGMTRDQLAALTTARLRDAAAQLEVKARFNGTSEFAEAQAKDMKDRAAAMRDLADQRDLLAYKEDRARMNPFDGAERAVKSYLDNIQQAGLGTEAVVTRALGNMEDAFVSLATGGKVNFKGLADSIIADLVRIQLRASITQASAGGGGGIFGSLISAGINYFTGGGSNPNYGNEGRNYPGVISGQRAAGGPVDAGRSYLVGEQGPEILRMGSSAGNVIPNDRIGGGARPVTLNVINNGQPTKATSTQRETSQGTVIDLVLDAWNHDFNSGGRTHDSIQRRFGLNPGGTTPRY